MKNAKYLAALIVTGAVALSGALVSTQALARDDGKKPGAAHMDKKDKDKKHDKAGGEVGSMAPAFELKDTDGNTVKLSDFKGKVVVIEWFNPECPFIVKHHKTFTTFNTLHDDYKSRDVVFLAINSSAKDKQGYGLDLNKTKKTEYKMSYPILLDESGQTGKAYGAKTTPHVFVIDTEGKIAYNGAIDNNDNPNKAGDKNYVKMALDEVLAKKPVTTSSTKPYGCGVKYAS
jgi:peroxiredoxin